MFHYNATFKSDLFENNKEPLTLTVKRLLPVTALFRSLHDVNRSVSGQTKFMYLDN